jgi:hypothetical protein
MMEGWNKNLKDACERLLEERMSIHGHAVDF